MLHFQPREAVEKTHYELVFHLEDGRGSAFAFACDEHGDVFRNQPPQIARYGLELCFKGKVDSFAVRRSVLRYHTQNVFKDAKSMCACGKHIVLGDA